MIAIVNTAIDAQEWLSRLDQQGAGSVVVHLGVVKPDPEGRKSAGITFERGGDLEAELKEIENYLREHLRIVDVIIVRRLGKLSIGDYILFGAVSANDRVNAFAACQELVEQCKKLKTLKKQEHYRD